MSAIAYLILLHSKGLQFKLDTESGFGVGVKIADVLLNRGLTQSIAGIADYH